MLGNPSGVSPAAGLDDRRQSEPMLAKCLSSGRLDEPEKKPISFGDFITTTRVSSRCLARARGARVDFTPRARLAVEGSTVRR